MDLGRCRCRRRARPHAAVGHACRADRRWMPASVEAPLAPRGHAINTGSWRRGPAGGRSRIRRRKSAASVHARAAASRASPGSAPRRSRSSTASSATAIPRAFRTWTTAFMWPRARPSWWPSARPSARTRALCERMSGSSSGFVPSRTPIASAVRSSARHATSDIGASVSARWISSALHPGNARLSPSSRYTSP